MLKETGLESAEKTKADMLAIFEKYNWKIETSKDTESWIDKTGKEITDYENEDLPNPGIEPRSPAFQADSLPAEPQIDMVKIIWSWQRQP